MKIFRNILAIVLGAVIGGAVNMALIIASPSIIPLPDGIEPGDMQSLVENIGLFEPKNFIMPFLAHALGTLVGAIIAGMVAATHKMYYSLVIGAFFLLGGISMAIDVDAPLWYDIVDIALAYIPMGYLGYVIAVKIGGTAKA